MGVSDAEIVLVSSTWLVALLMMLPLAGFAEPIAEFQSIASPSGSATNTTDPDSAAESPSFLQTLICVAIKGLITALIQCTFAGRAVITTISTVSDILLFAAALISFFWQGLTLQLPAIPGFLQAIMFVPPFTALAFVGAKLIVSAIGAIIPG